MPSHDMISIFNRLTRSELADCELFKNILDLHYQKFRYFYSHIENMSLDGVKKIECVEKSTKLCIYISFKNKKERENFCTLFDAHVESPTQVLYTKYFGISTEKEGSKLNISIENKNICREEDIYENRLNSD